MQNQISTPPVNEQTIRLLESLLIKEIKLYTDYHRLIEEEEHWATRFNATKLEAMSRKRLELHDAMLYFQDKRLKVMRAFPESEGTRLRDLVLKYFHPREAKRLLPLIDRLRSLVEAAERRGQEYDRVLGFSSKLVHGVISIFYSATQNVVKGYGRSGKLTEKFHPGGNQRKGSSILKQA